MHNQHRADAVLGHQANCLEHRLIGIDGNRQGLLAGFAIEQLADGKHGDLPLFVSGLYKASAMSCMSPLSSGFTVGG